MKRTIAIILTLLACAKIQFAQSVNLVIEINEKLVVEGLSAMCLRFGPDTETNKFAVEYVPGELTLNEEIWKIINNDTSARFSLHFDYSTFDKDKHQITNFHAELSPSILKQPYLILSIYDFRDKKYKRLYQWHTADNFLVELRYPNSGVYIRKK